MNEQFSAEWELEREHTSKNPGQRKYGGDSPVSETEAIVIANLTKRRDFARGVLAFHTQGEVIYWGFKNRVPPKSEVRITAFSRVSGDEPVKTSNSYASYKDWFIQDWRRPGFTIEPGRGINPLPLTQFDQIYEDALGIFLAGVIL